MSQHTGSFTLPGKHRIQEVSSRIMKDINQLRFTAEQRVALFELVLSVDWSDEDKITASVQTAQETLYGLIATSFEAPDSGEILTPSQDFRRLESKLRLTHNVTQSERAVIDLVQLHDDVMFMLGLKVG